MGTGQTTVLTDAKPSRTARPHHLLAYDRGLPQSEPLDNLTVRVYVVPALETSFSTVVYGSATTRTGMAPFVAAYTDLHDEER
jgi:hypothetical protein